MKGKTDPNRILPHLLVLCTLLGVIPLSCVSTSRAVRSGAASGTGEVDHPTLIRSTLAIVQMRLDEGKPEAAHHLLGELRSKVGADPEIENMRGLIHLALGNTDAAERTLKRTLAHHPRPHVALNLSSALIQGGKYASARQILTRHKSLFATYPRRERMIHNLALCAQAEGQVDQAERLLRQALELDPAFTLSWIVLGEIAETRGQPEQARLAYAAAARVCPGCPGVAAALSRLLIAAGEPLRSLDVIQNYLRASHVRKLDSANPLFVLARTALNQVRARRRLLTKG